MGGLAADLGPRQAAWELRMQWEVRGRMQGWERWDLELGQRTQELVQGWGHPGWGSHEDRESGLLYSI